MSRVQRVARVSVAGVVVLMALASTADLRAQQYPATGAPQGGYPSTSFAPPSVPSYQPPPAQQQQAQPPSSVGFAPNPQQAAWPPAQQPAPAVAQAQAPPNAPQNGAGQAPFVLTPDEQLQLDRVLRAWEVKSSEVKNLKCSFKLRKYGGAFAQNGGLTKEVDGQVTYVAPDKGSYEINEPNGEHWMCDGDAIYEFNAQKKEVVVRPLPPHLKGKAISDGPLPFLFGMTAEKIKARYWVHLLPPAQPNQIWLEAYPKFQQDRANFEKVTVILDAQQVMPVAMAIYQPGNSWESYVFSQDRKVNDAWETFKNLFNPPVVPFGWKKTIDKMEAPAVAAQPPAPQSTAGRMPFSLFRRAQ